MKIKYIKKVLLFFALMNLFVFIGLVFFYKLTEISVFDEYDTIKKLSRPPSTYHENNDSTASLSVLNKTKNGYKFKYCKSKHLQHTFSAAYFPLEDLNVDFSSYDRIEVSLKSNLARRIPIQLSMHYGDSLVRYLTNYIEYSPGAKVYLLDLSEFETPSEWYSSHNVSENELPEPNFSNIRTISIESCHLLAKGIEDEYIIKNIKIVKSTMYYWYFFLTFNLCFTLFVIIDLFKRKEVEEKIIHVPINPVETKEPSHQTPVITQIESYIANHYNDPELSLKQVENALGITSVSKELKNKFHLTFPQYINKLRVEEAKRLLKANNEMTVSEIGYAVGFNSPSNFGRVFKKIEGIAPNKLK